MSKRGRSPSRLDLRLNLSPANSSSAESSSEFPTSSNNSSETTVEGSSCVSSEAEGSPETRAMLLVGCPRCLMYVMLSGEDPKCPKCKSTVLLDFLREDNTSTKKTNN